MVQRGPVIPPPNPHGGGGTTVPRDDPDRAQGNQGRETQVVTRGPQSPTDPPPITDGTPPDDGGQGLLPSDLATQRTNPEPRSREISTTSPEGDAIPANFGKSRSSPDLLYMKSDGISKLYFAWSWGWGPNNAIYDFELDNQPGTLYGMNESSLTFNIYLGTADQPLDPLLSAYDPVNWFSAYPGLCYVTGVLDNRVPANQTVNPMNMKATVEGLLGPDHRLDPSLVNQYYNENPVLALAQLFMDQSWGFQTDTTQMLWPSWDESSDDADLVIATPTDGVPGTAPSVVVSGYGTFSLGIREWGYTWLYDNGLETTLSPESSELSNGSYSGYAVDVSGMDTGTANVVALRLYRRKRITDAWGPWNFVKEFNPPVASYHDPGPDIASGGSHPPSSDDKAQFRIGLKLDHQASMRDWIETFRTLFTGFIAFNNGLFQCYVDKIRDETGYSYNETNITGNIEVLSVGIAEIPARAIVNFVDQDGGFVSDDSIYPPGAPVPAETIMRSERRDFTFQCDGCPSPDQADRISMWAWKRGQRRHRIRWRANQQGILPLPGSIVNVSHAAMDIGTAKVIVTSTGPVDESLGWNLAGEIYDINDFSTQYGGHWGTNPGGGDQPPVLPPPPPPGSEFVLMATFWFDNTYIPNEGG